MNICVIGTGYVGLVTGACLAEFGMNLICVDNDHEKISLLREGKVSIHEPGLEGLVTKNMKDGRLRFSESIEEGVTSSLVIFIAVGTPSGDDGSADLRAVEDVAKEIARGMNGYRVIAVKSTVPVGTCRRLKQLIQDHQTRSVPFDLVSNPEFQREGSAIEDFMRPDRVTIGAESEQAIAIMKDIYSALYLIETPFVITSLETAEMIKYAANAFLATKVSFINEIANLCELVGADVHHVARAMGLDGRIGKKFLHPGPGYGGSCFPKDVKALIHTAKKHGYDLKVLNAVEEVNQHQKLVLYNKLMKYFSQDISGKTIAVWGLSFKPNTDDVREAPSLVLIENLLKAGAKVRAFDPVSMPEAKKAIHRLMPDLPLDNICFAKDIYDAVLDADALMLVTEWKEFRLPSWGVIRKSMKQALVLDGRNIYDKKELQESGFVYETIG